MDAGKPVDSYIAPFERLLRTINPEDISTELYCRKYLGHILQHRSYYLAIYAHLLEKLLHHSALPKDEIILVDFGAGNGLLGLFAKYCGIKNVFMNDIDPAFVRSAEKLSSILSISLDGYITGDIDAVRDYFQGKKFNAIAGTDVIEHIYDLEYFFTTLRTINPSVVSAFSTASNPGNYFKVRQLRKLQLKDEYAGGAPDDFLLFGNEAHEPFILTRENIIRSKAADLQEAEIKQLAKATRGMVKADILSAVESYRVNKVFPEMLSDPTNTCNPVTGSWTERILSIEAYRSLYRQNGFSLNVYNGFYDQYKKGLKGLINNILNKTIPILGKYLAPYIVLTGSKK